MDMTGDIQEKILKNASAGEIRELALRHGMRSLSDDGWRLVGQGITTPEEVMRATKDQTFGKETKEEPKPAAPAEDPKKRHGLVSV